MAFLGWLPQWHDTGERGHELADTVGDVALNWLKRHGHESDWLCHVTFWDVHTPYRTPANYGDPFVDDPAPSWPDAELLHQHAQAAGLRSARDSAWSKSQAGPRQPAEVTDRASFHHLMNGYDTAIRVVDDWVGRLLEMLSSLGVREETTVVITADHGEDFGEFGAYSSHCFCGPSVARVPMIICGPDIPHAELTGLHQHFDLSATLLDLAGYNCPPTWNAQSFRHALMGDADAGRDVVTSSMLAQGVQRAVYWREEGEREPWGYVHTWHDLQHGVPPECVFAPTDRAGRGRSPNMPRSQRAVND